MKQAFTPSALTQALTYLREAQDKVWAALQREYPLGTLVKGRGKRADMGRVIAYTEAAGKPGVIYKSAVDGTEKYVGATQVTRVPVAITRNIPQVVGHDLPQRIRRILITTQRDAHDHALD